MKEHKTHNILGKYCWTCKTKTEAGLPGWPKAHRGDSTRYSVWAKNDITGEGCTNTIIWANGDADQKRDTDQPCSVCSKHCAHPVKEGFKNRRGQYREIGQVRVFGLNM